MHKNRDNPQEQMQPRKPPPPPPPRKVNHGGWFVGTIQAVKAWVKRETEGMCGPTKDEQWMYDDMEKRYPNLAAGYWTQKESDAIEAEKQETMHRKRVEKYYGKPLQHHADRTLTSSRDWENVEGIDEGCTPPADEFKEGHAYVSPTPDLDALCERVKNNPVPIWMKTFQAPAAATVESPESVALYNKIKQDFQDLHTGPQKSMHPWHEPEIIMPPMGPTERRLTGAYNQIVQEQEAINEDLKEKVANQVDDMWGLKFEGGQPKKVTFAEHAADEKAKGGNWKPTNPKDLMGIRKVSLCCLPWPVIGEGALGMQEGGMKYGRHNYRDEGVAASTYVDAAMRHLLQFWEGEDIDEESGIHHIGKAISTLFVLRDAQLNDMCTDDRPIRPKNVSWLKDLNVKASALVDKYPQPEKPYTHKPLPERK
jgi:hypothetical protein